jgi:uncharacterized integral membrane protein
MKVLYTFFVSIFIAAVLIFCFQNWQTTQVSLGGYQIQLPLAVVSIIIYSFGALTGSLIFKLIKKGLGSEAPKEKEEEQ